MSLPCFFDKVDKSRAYSVGYIAPSLTTFETGKPAFREYIVDGVYDNSTFQVLDYRTYHMDLDEANKNPRDDYDPEWTVTESVKRMFNLASLAPSEWAKFATRLDNNATEFSNFYQFYMKYMPGASYTPADKKAIICHLTSSRSDAKCVIETEAV